MISSLQVLVNQGEFFASSGIIFLQPDYVTRLLKPLVDHRVGKTPEAKSDISLGGTQILGFTIKDAVRAALLTSAVSTFVEKVRTRPHDESPRALPPPSAGR